MSRSGLNLRSEGHASKNSNKIRENAPKYLTAPAGLLETPKQFGAFALQQNKAYLINIKI